MTARITIVTTNRSDYGPAYWIIRELFSRGGTQPLLMVGGAHLCAAYGETVSEIEHDGWPIAERVAFLANSNEQVEWGRAAGAALQGFADAFARHEPDLIVLSGDRFELLPIATAALMLRIPVAHVGGGDVTEGAIDEQVRHAVTKLAHLHFPGTPGSARRILALGEEPWRVHQVGDPALDHFRHDDFATPAEVAARLGFTPDYRTTLVTFHPETANPAASLAAVKELCAALASLPGPFVVTAPAADPGAAEIRAHLDGLVGAHPDAVMVSSLGSRLYRSLLLLVGCMVGNSSSGLIEASVVPLPVVNIGGRQHGRDRGPNVIDCPPERDAILAAVERARSDRFRRSLKGTVGPYGDGHAARRIADILNDLPSRERLLKKRFPE